MNVQKIISLLLTLLFLLFAYFQLNDPDPEYWTPIYLVAALGCGLVFFNKAPAPIIYYGIAVIYLIGAFFQWPPQFEGILFGEMKMRSLNIELARESLGLVICAASMGLMGILKSKKKRARSGWDLAFKKAIANGNEPENDMFEGMKNEFDDTEWK